MPDSADYERVEVGVRYCVAHHGIANEDDEVCDFTPDRQIEDCDFRQLWYEQSDGSEGT